MKIFTAAILALTTLLCCGCGSQGEVLTTTFFDVGKADCMLLQAQGGALMIDAGTQKDGTEVAAKLRAMGVESIDAFILTHFDKDHVGGAAEIIRDFGVKRIFHPTYIKESEYTTAFFAAAEAAGAEVTVVDAGNVVMLPLGTAEVAIYPPEKAEYEKDQSNNSSLVLSVVHGENRFLLTADAQEERIYELTPLLNVEYDLLKVPHHGEYEDCLPEFFAVVGAKEAIVTSSNKNPEDAETLDALEAADSRIWLTKNGDVTVRSDGARIRISQ